MRDENGLPALNPFEEAFERIKRSTGLRTQVEVAKLLEIRQSSISDAKRRRSVPDGWLIKLYQVYGLNPNWILDGEQPQFLGEQKGGAALVRENLAGYAAKPRHHTVPVCSMTLPDNAAGPWREVPLDALTVSEQFYRPSLLVVRMEEDSMEPAIRRGAFVGVDKERKTVRSGAVYALDIPMEGLVIKRVDVDAENARLILRSDNRAYSDQALPAASASERIIGRVAWICQEL